MQTGLDASLMEILWAPICFTLWIWGKFRPRNPHSLIPKETEPQEVRRLLEKVRVQRRGRRKS